jgi:hypothetical protein
MYKEITSDIVSSFADQLENHPVYEAVQTIEDLQCFMEHHVYSVWDFMSLIKYLQSVVAPTTYPWKPMGDASVRRFINELVLEEESDETRLSGEHASHFELYQKAMIEIGASIDVSSRFVGEVGEHGIKRALDMPGIPKASARFTRQTFDFIRNDKPHEVAAALALGREHIIPAIFRAILNRMQVSEKDAPTFHFYLNRHIHLDEDFHAPLSLRLLNSLCAGDEIKIQEAINAARTAVTARLKFWDGVHEAILQSRGSIRHVV